MQWCAIASVTTIDIHVGGADLQFPHHENEIAQSEAATGQPLATYWMHNGMVNVDGTKMSKSLGNFTTIRSLLDSPDGPDPMAVRMFVMQSQYRMPLDFTEEAIASAKNGWVTLNEGLNFGRYIWQLSSTGQTQRSAVRLKRLYSNFEHLWTMTLIHRGRSRSYLV